jgi:pyruvate-formate lyase-activating enzyme
MAPASAPSPRVSLPVLGARAPVPVEPPVPEGAPVPTVDGPMLDRFARPLRYLRISVTDRCNYACTYCVPDAGIAHQPRADLLTFEELERVVSVFVELGVERVRLTGGEPTVRAKIEELVARLAARVPTVVMTSNGHRLPELAAPLAQAGLVGVNVSLDTLDAERFARLTRGGELERVVAGIDAARAAGLVVKLNAVALRGESTTTSSRPCASSRGAAAPPCASSSTCRCPTARCTPAGPRSPPPSCAPPRRRSGRWCRRRARGVRSGAGPHLLGSAARPPARSASSRP